MPAPLLDISNLSVSYRTDAGVLRALRDVSMRVDSGRITGIVGESGCGKSTLISTIARLLAPNAQVEQGAILFKGDDLLSLGPDAMRELRGVELAMVFQDPMTCLNPVMTIGRQMTDIQYRDDLSGQDKLRRAIRLLDRVGIPDPAAHADRYPHQLSGGMRQRVAIAMALMTRPALLIADEPTTALDATLEVQIIHRLQQLQEDIGCAVLFISHHLGVIAEFCDDVVVMYAGEVVESGPVREVFLNPQHPYTMKLLECDPARIEEVTRFLPVIPGGLPDLIDLPDGCVFRDRCDAAVDRCRRDRPSLEGAAHKVACHVGGR